MNAECKLDESQKPSGRKGFKDIFNTLFRFKRRSLSNVSGAHNIADDIPTHSRCSDERRVTSCSVDTKVKNDEQEQEQVVINRYTKTVSNVSSTGSKSLSNVSIDSQLARSSTVRRMSNASDRSVLSSPEILSLTSGQRRQSTGTSSIVTFQYRSSIRTFRNLDKDLETLRLSRHDNPIVQRKMLQSYVSEPEVAFSNTSQCRTSKSEKDCSETLILKPILPNPSAANQVDFLTPHDYHPLNVVQQHLVRSPPPYISTLRQFGYSVGRSSDVKQDECTCTSQSYYVHAEEIQRAPLPHVRQSCPMFRPLVHMQKGIFNDHRDHRKQPKDLRPLLSLSSDDVIEASSYALAGTRRRHLEDCREGNVDVSELSSCSPTVHIVPRRNKKRSILRSSRYPVTYPLQKTI